MPENWMAPGRTGGTGRSARLIPLTVDGLIYASSMVSGGPSAVSRRCAWVLGGALSQHICQVWCLLS
jgi:hypothetical protein